MNSDEATARYSYLLGVASACAGDPERVCSPPERGDAFASELQRLQRWYVRGYRERIRCGAGLDYSYEFDRAWVCASVVEVP